jgi:Zn finger protein HypA/HybF involved in hydrogenase expression
MSDLLTNLENEEENKINSSAKNEHLSIEQEIECPRCHGIMMLQITGYFCEECDFALRLTPYW